jgi:hypothetical protein
MPSIEKYSIENMFAIFVAAGLEEAATDALARQRAPSEVAL